jgi:hypothetical protein
MAHQLQGNFKIYAGTCLAIFCFRAGSLDVGDAPASQMDNIKANTTLLDMVSIPEQQKHLKNYMEGKNYSVDSLSGNLDEEY